MHDYRLTFGEAEVPYLYGAGCTAELAPAITERLGEVDALLFVVDKTVTGHAAQLIERLAGSVRVEVHVVEALERNKTLAAAQSIMECAVDRGLTRRSVMVAMGGGTVGNVAGLAASLLFRGIRLVHLPTTPVAAFDATISLKQGVNLRAGKNLCGAYLVPALIACDLAWLTTVPRGELLTGLAEMVKNVLVAAPALQDKLIGALDALAEGDAGGDIGGPFGGERAGRTTQALGELLEIGIEAKAPYLRADPRERGDALVFEYGHTAGHAIEFVNGGAVSHGEAVAWGMLAAAEVGRLRYGLGASDVATHYRLMSRLDLPDPARRLGGLDRDAIRAVLTADNKRGYGPCAPDEVLMVVLEAVGQPAAGPSLPLVPVPTEVLMAALDAVAQAAEGARR